MEKVTILELYRTARNSNQPLFGDTTDLAAFDFMTEYVSKYTRLDRNFAKTHAHFAPLWNVQYENDKQGVYTSFRDDVVDLITKNSESYQRLWDALIEAEYNPVENYDRFEEIISNYGKTKRTDKFGPTQRTENFASKTDQENKGATHESEVLGQRNDNTHDMMQGFNSANANETNSSTSQTGAQTNTTDVNAVVNSYTNGAHIDTFSEIGKENTSEDDAREDKVNNHTHGNIGVTSAEDLITQEVVLRTSNRFYEILFNDIITELCILVDTADFGAFSICLNKKQKVLKEIATYDDFTMYVDEESGLYVVYENGAVVPNFTYDQTSGNLYIEDREGYEIHLRFDEETGELYRIEE